MTALDFPTEAARRLVATALDEDLGPDGLDVTSTATIPGDQQATGHVVAREAGVLAGAPVIDIVLAGVAERTGGRPPAVDVRVADGTRLQAGDVIAVVAGATQQVLMAERTLLNIMSRLSGVATHTRRWADALAGTGCTVLDTRKTTPGLRALEKYAVRAGGGGNHRFGLDDAMLIKDNHIALAGGIRDRQRLAVPRAAAALAFLGGVIGYERDRHRRRPQRAGQLGARPARAADQNPPGLDPLDARLDAADARRHGAFADDLGGVEMRHQIVKQVTAR